MRASLDMPITLDREHDLPLHAQLVQHLRKAITTRVLSAGTRLPSTRTLALTLGVSRNVVVTAYDELFAEGYLEGQMGSGTYVSQDLPASPRLVRPFPPTPPRWVRPTTLPLLDMPRSEPDMIEFRLG